jgi:drug/metabolite transporter (DMT)-like permease
MTMGAAILPPLGYLVFSPRTRIRPKGRMTREMRSNTAVGCFVMAVLVLLAAWSLHDAPTATPGAWVGVGYLGVLLAALGLWVLRTELTD